MHMTAFPAVDPIPLPAPVWLFKALHVVTLSLHFVALEMLLGGLLIAVWLNFSGKKQGDPLLRTRMNASASLANRLPVVMTYVINLGVPPLLFAQVLYGRALYTSSVLIGVYWIGVIFLLTLCYWLLYRFAAACAEARSGWWLGAASWLIAGVIAKIYSANMTLMLRPEVWQGMYAQDALGSHLPTGDPTLLFRWLFMLTGGFVAAGIWMIWLAGRKSLEADCRTYLSSLGGRVAIAGALLQAVLAYLVWNNQTEVVRAAVSKHTLTASAGYAWIAMMVVVLGVGGVAAIRKLTTPVFSAAATAVGIVTIMAMTLFRDGLRDMTLLSKGFDVWERKLQTNWSVVIIFLVTFVIGLVFAGWLISVVIRARPVKEKVA